MHLNNKTEIRSSTFENDPLSNIISYLSPSPHQPNWEIVKLTQVSKQFRDITHQFHPVLQIIEKVRNNQILFLDDSIQYTYPMNWAWKLDDMICLFKSKMESDFVTKFSLELQQSIPKFTDLVSIQSQEENFSKKQKTIQDTNKIYLSTIFNICKQKILFDKFLTCLISAQKTTYEMRKREQKLTYDFLYSLYEDEMITEEYFNNKCQDIMLILHSCTGRALQENKISFASIIQEAARNIIDKDDENRSDLTIQDWVDHLNDKTMDLCNISINSFQESRKIAKDINFQFVLNELFDTLKPEQKFQLLGCIECYSHDENYNLDKQFIPLTATVLIKAINEYDVWLKLLEIDSKSELNLKINGCHHLKIDELGQMCSIYLITTGLFNHYWMS